MPHPTPRRRTRRIVPLVAVLVTILATLATATPAGAQWPSPVRCAPSHMSRAEALNWDNAHRDGFYAGADITGATDIGGGRTAWLMGDTWIGGGYGPGAFVNNTIIVEHSNRCFEHVMGWSGHAWNGIIAGNASHFYWPLDAIMDNGRLHVFFTRYARGAGDPFIGGAPDAVVRAQINPANWAVESLTAVAGGSQLGFGSSIVAVGGHTYVYGQRFTYGDNAAPDVMLARVPTGYLAHQNLWEYWDGTGFSSDIGATVPVLGNVMRNAVSFNAVGGRIVAVGQEGTFRNTRLAQYEAANPWGPFTRTRTLMDIPNFVPPNQPASDGFVYHGGATHTSGNGSLLAVYSYNTFNQPPETFGSPWHYGNQWREVGLTDAMIRFSDVPSNAFYTVPVNWMADSGLTTGIGNTGRFDPNGGMTRGDLAVFLWRHAGQPAPLSGNRFVDVDSNSHMSAPIAWMVDAGITTGVGGSNRFEPARVVTRGELATFLWRYARHPQPTAANRFVDVAPRSFYEVPIAWMVGEGITTGVAGTNRFEPDRTVTRGEFATFLYRYHHS